MYHQLSPEAEVLYRQQQVRTTFIEAQRQVSVSGLREILGNTLLELGSRIHGMAHVSCTAAAETRRQVRDARHVPTAASSSLQATVMH